jgi:hypothetical protein
MTSLRRRMTEDMRVRNLSPHTQATYVQQVSLFARHFNKSPEILGPEEIRSYQVYLTNERKLAPSSIIIAVAALRFLYKITLRKDWSLEEIIPTPKKPQKLPTVLPTQASHTDQGYVMMERTAFGSRSNCAAQAWPDQAPRAALPDGSSRRKSETETSIPRHHHRSLQAPRSHKTSHALISSGYIGSWPEIEPTINTHRPRPGQRFSPTHF